MLAENKKLRKKLTSKKYIFCENLNFLGKKFEKFPQNKNQ